MSTDSSVAREVEGPVGRVVWSIICILIAVVVAPIAWFLVIRLGYTPEAGILTPDWMPSEATAIVATRIAGIAALLGIAALAIVRLASRRGEDMVGVAMLVVTGAAAPVAFIAVVITLFGDRA